MPQIKEPDLKKQLRSKEFARLYFLYGEEKYLISFYAGQLVEKLLGRNPSDFDFQQLQGADATVDGIAEAVEALPMMSEKKCVRVDDLDVEAMNAQELSKLYELLEDLPESCVLLIAQTTLQMDGKRSAKWKKFLTAAEKAGAVVPLEKRGAAALEKQLVEWAAKRNCTLTPADAGRMVQMCGDDLTTLGNELEKLCAYAAGRAITREDIEAVVTQNLETTVFVMAKALVAGDYDRAYRQLDLLFYQKEEPVAVLAVLASSFIDLYRVCVAKESGENIGVIAADFQYKGKEFRLKNAERDLRRMNIEYLRACLEIMIETDAALKSSRVDRRVLMEEMFARMMLCSQKERVL
jgi:DNA polymerase-3 subunit delta